jgi:acetyltransferase
MTAKGRTNAASALIPSPDSIALIGASRDLEKIRAAVVDAARTPSRKIYPVNPNYGDIDGLQCYKSISDVGQPIDLAIVIIPARAVLAALEQCAAAGVKNAVVISSGFAEEGGDSATMQDAIVALAKLTGMRISGPNAEGFYSQVQRVAATFSPTVDGKSDEQLPVASQRRIGIVAQSGGIGFAIYHRARALGIALSYVVSTGNESDLGAGEFFEFMVQDASTDVILLFIEGIRDVDKFLAAARRAAEMGKPVIVTKVGRSGAGERAAASHTASMAGWSAAYDAVFAKYGFIVSNDLDEAVTIAALLTTNPLPKGDRVAVLTVSGGAGIWGADTVAMQGLRVPELSQAIQRRSEAAAVLWCGRQSDRSPRRARIPADCRGASTCSPSPTRSTPSSVVLSVERYAMVQAGRSSGLSSDAQHKPIVFYSTRCRRPRAQRVGIRGRGAVGTDPCRRRAAADGRARAVQLAPAVDAAAALLRDISAHLKSATLSRIRQAARCARPAWRCPTKCW